MVYLLFFFNTVLFLEAVKHRNPIALSSYITYKELTPSFYNSSSHYDTALDLQLLIPSR